MPQDIDIEEVQRHFEQLAELEKDFELVDLEIRKFLKTHFFSSPFVVIGVLDVVNET